MFQGSGSRGVMDVGKIDGSGFVFVFGRCRCVMLMFLLEVFKNLDL